jgi:hypothetical protein
MPHTDEELVHAEKRTCFYEQFVLICPAYPTHNINLNANFDNGILVSKHLLTLNSIYEKTSLIA